MTAPTTPRVTLKVTAQSSRRHCTRCGAADVTEHTATSLRTVGALPAFLLEECWVQCSACGEAYLTAEQSMAQSARYRASLAAATQQYLAAAITVCTTEGERTLRPGSLDHALAHVGRTALALDAAIRHAASHPLAEDREHGLLAIRHARTLHEAALAAARAHA